MSGTKPFIKPLSRKQRKKRIEDKKVDRFGLSYDEIGSREVLAVIAILLWMGTIFFGIVWIGGFL